LKRGLKKFCTAVLRRVSIIEITVKCIYDLYGSSNWPTGKSDFKTNIELGLKKDSHLIEKRKKLSLTRKRKEHIVDCGSATLGRKPFGRKTFDRHAVFVAVLIQIN